MSEENKAIARRFLTEIQNKKNLAIIDELVADDFVGHTANVRGHSQLKQAVIQNLTEFPDLRVTIEDQVSEGDRVVSHCTARGTHRGTYRGVAPTGNLVTYSVVNIHRLADGKIAEGWRVADRLDIMGQIGGMP